MNLNEDFKEFLQFLNSNDVRYLVIGGYAVAAHGHVRYTKDIDVWIEQTEAMRVQIFMQLFVSRPGKVITPSFAALQVEFSRRCTVAAGSRPMADR